MARYSRRYSYSALRDLICWSLADCPGFGSGVEVDGKLNRISDGIWHDNYWFRIRGRNLPTSRTDQAYILRILEQHEDWQQGPEPHDRLMREAETLQVLTKTDFAHQTPRFTCFVKEDESEPIGMIETAVSGYSLHGHRGPSTLRLVSRVAADIHRLRIDRFSHLPLSTSRTEHLKSRLAELDGPLFAEFPLASEARNWITAHTPSDDRCCLLHGDLLPQNLICDLPTSDQENAVVGVVDWEMARVGDPAYDLAIVSRGDRKVLGMRDGLNVLVENYLEFGGLPISITDVRVHELLLVLHWLDESWREHQKPRASGHGPEYYEAKLESLFRRAVG